MCDGLDAQDVCASATEDEVDIDVVAEVALEKFGGSFSIAIITVGDDVTLICSDDRVKYFWVNAGVVIACETAFWTGSLHKGKRCTSEQKHRDTETQRAQRESNALNL